MPGAPLYLCLRVENDLDGVLASETSDKSLVEPQLAEDGVGVFSQCGDGIHTRLDALHGYGRQHGFDGTVRCLDLPPTVPRLKQVVLPKFLHGIKVRVGDLRLLQTLHHLCSGKLGEGTDDDLAQLLLMNISLAVAVEARVGGES